MPKDPATADRLRHEIDRGRSGDKVDFSDPAAAPLGTDDEAAGTPPSEAQLRRAQEAELGARPDDPSAGRDDRTIRSLQFPGGARKPWGLIAAIVGVVALVLILLLLA